MIRALERRFARAVTFGITLTNENAVEVVSALIVRLLREGAVPGNAVKRLGFAAPADITMAVEELLSPSDIFLPPDIEITILPMLSGGAGGDFTAVLAAGDPAGRQCYRGGCDWITENGGGFRRQDDVRGDTPEGRA